MEHKAVVVFHCYWWCSGVVQWKAPYLAVFLASHPNACMFGGMYCLHSHIQTKNLVSRIDLNLAGCSCQCLLHRVLYFKVMHFCNIHRLLDPGAYIMPVLLFLLCA